MEPKNVTGQQRMSEGKRNGSDPYDLETPRWQQFYKRVRKTIRFPRYYKKDLNW